MTIRVLQGLCVAGVMVVLTGANGEGCSGPETGGGNQPPEPPNPCEEGTHLELICEPHPCGDDGVVHDHAEADSGQEPGDPGDECYEECVPDALCPPGTQEQVICAAPMPYPGCEDGDESCDAPHPVDPPDGECFVECVPVDDCGPGFYQEWVCESFPGGDPVDPDGPVPLSMPCYDDENCEPPPPEECYPICLPIDDCGPGFHEEFMCEEPPGPPPKPCDPDGNCAPDEDGIDEPSSGGGMGGEPFCDVVCIPDDGGCPPDAPPIMVCEAWDDFVECWEECLPPSDCPPPLVLEVVCEDSPDGNGGGCYETCVDPGDPVDPDPQPGEPDPAN